MKIKKGYTLSQFVDKYTELDKTESYYINDDILQECDDDRFVINEILDKIVLYNDFLKKPLTKEMFVNYLEKPIGYNTWLTGNGGADGIACMRWREAEKKVIFEGFKPIVQAETCVLVCDEFDIMFGDNERISLIYTNNRGKIYWIKTLHDLFEAVKDLPLKNVEL